MHRMGFWHGNSKSVFAGRLSWLRIVLALAFLGGFLLSTKLWAGSRYYPLAPIFEWMPVVPP